MRRVAGFLSVLTIAACVLPAAPSTIRELASRARFATALLPASEAERRAIDFVMLDPAARDLAVFTAALVAAIA